MNDTSDVNFVDIPLCLNFSDASENGPSQPEVVTLPNIPQNDGKLAFVLKDVLSKEECELIIESAESRGFRMAGLGAGKNQVQSTSLRDSYRLMTDDEKLAGAFFSRIKHSLPRVWNNRFVSGFNPRLRILKYNPTQKFVTHMDGTVVLGDKRSFFTFHLYLTTVTEGGATVFAGRNRDEDVRCMSEQGKVLVFEQKMLLHSGEEVRSGQKYTIRTDIMYEEPSLGAFLYSCLGFGGSPRDDWKTYLLYGGCLTAGIAYYVTNKN